ncbi:hypothetical protein H4R99_003396 [Coemansia sp. RSA 1722]|nr:hypothetical protein H4R99_003396 [Coemansia sp. RSA 1722]
MIGTLLQARNCYDFRPGSAKHLTVDLRTIEDTEQDEFFEWTSSVFGSSCQYKSTLLRIRSCKLLPDMSQAHWYMLTQLDMDMTVPDRFLLNVVYRLIGLQILAVKSVLLDEGYMCLTVVSAMTKARQLKAIQLGSHLFKLAIGELCGKFSTSILEKNGILFDLISAIVSLRRVRLPGTCRRSVEELVASSSASIPHIAKIDFAF